MTLLATTAAEARKVTWQAVEVRSGDDGKRVAATLKGLLKTATKRAKWGDGDKLEMKARVKKLEWEAHDDVLRVSVTVVARIKGGETARSHIRLGGHPKDRRKIEKEALKIVADGLVTRLSDIARREAAAAKKAREEAEAEEAEEDDEE